jgi:hypothetical protein
MSARWVLGTLTCVGHSLTWDCGANSMTNHLPYDILSRLVEQRASPTEDARAQRHLNNCGRCRSELAWLERIRTLPQRGGDAGHGGGPSLGESWGSFRGGRSALFG